MNLIQKRIAYSQTSSVSLFLFLNDLESRVQDLSKLIAFKEKNTELFQAICEKVETTYQKNTNQDPSLLFVAELSLHVRAFQDSRDPTLTGMDLIQLLSQQQKTHLFQLHLAQDLCFNFSHLSTFRQTSLATTSYGGEKKNAPLRHLAQLYYSILDNPKVVYDSHTHSTYLEAVQEATTFEASAKPESELLERLKSLRFLKCEGRTLYFFDPSTMTHVGIKFSKNSEKETELLTTLTPPIRYTTIVKEKEIFTISQPYVDVEILDKPETCRVHPLAWEGAANRWIQTLLRLNSKEEVAAEIPTPQAYYRLSSPGVLPEALHNALEDAQVKGQFSLSSGEILVYEYACNSTYLDRLRDTKKITDFMNTSQNALYSHGYLGSKGLTSFSPGGFHGSISFSWNFSGGAGKLSDWLAMASFENMTPTHFGISDLKWVRPLTQDILEELQHAQNCESLLGANIRNGINGDLTKFDLQVVMNALGKALFTWTLVFGKWLRDHDLFPDLNEAGEFQEKGNQLSISEIATHLKAACNAWLEGYFHKLPSPPQVSESSVSGFSFERWASQMALFMTPAYIRFFESGWIPSLTGAFEKDVYLGTCSKNSAEKTGERFNFSDKPVSEELATLLPELRLDAKGHSIYGWITRKYVPDAVQFEDYIAPFPLYSDRETGLLYVGLPEGVDTTRTYGVSKYGHYQEIAPDEKNSYLYIFEGGKLFGKKFTSIFELVQVSQYHINLGAFSGRFPLYDMIAGLFHITAKALVLEQPPE